MSAREILWNIHKNQTPSNRQILRELPYTLQGISSSTFTWVEPLPPDPMRAQKTSDGDMDIEYEDDDEQTTTVLALPTHLPWQKIGQLSRLMEPAVLYRNIKEELHRREKAPKTGLVLQALDSAIENELRSYLAFVGVVETEVRRQEMTLQAPDAGVSKEAREYGIGGRMTLTRSIVLLQEATLGLRLVRMILEETQGLVGGQILSLVHAYTYHGDEFVAKFAQRLVPQVARSFFDMLSQWMLSGQLVDPHEEFFIRRTNNNAGGNSADDSNPWDGTFYLAEAYIPDYISREVAEQIFQIGKTLHFIAGACDDREWVDERRALARLDPGVLQLPDSQLREEVSETYERVVSHLNDLLRNKFHLDAHLRGLKDYLLLGKGDFVQLLVESVAPVLERPALQLFRHHLTATLETAVRGSNARHDHPDVLRALDARMLELGHGDIGWDVFTLDYRVEEPLNAVIWDHKSMKEYLRVFNFLWRIKRVSFTLNTTWRQLTLMDRAATRARYLRHPSETNIANRMVSSNTIPYKSSVYGLYHPLVGGLWQGVRDMCCEMVHFVSELEYYINYEVVEMAWGELTRRLDTGDLSVDEIAAAHREYLRTITHKGLLGGGDFLMGELHSLLKIVLAFGVTCEGLHDMSERLHAQSLAQRDGQNNGGVDPGNSILKRIKKIDATLTDLRSQFQASLRRLVQALGKQEDSEMRFLGVRLNFNGFYS